MLACPHAPLSQIVLIDVVVADDEAGEEPQQLVDRLVMLAIVADIVDEQIEDAEDFLEIVLLPDFHGAVAGGVDRRVIDVEDRDVDGLAVACLGESIEHRLGEGPDPGLGRERRNPADPVAHAIASFQSGRGRQTRRS